MAQRPVNHVTRAAEGATAPSAVGLPTLERHQLQRLEDAFPPRCMRVGEPLEEHLRYAGKVELLRDLRAVFDEAHQSEDGGDLDEFDPRDGQRAS